MGHSIELIHPTLPHLLCVNSEVQAERGGSRIDLRVARDFGRGKDIGCVDPCRKIEIPCAPNLPYH